MADFKTKLSVNINKLATIRNARGGNNPNLIEFTQKIEQYGAEGITVHPRPDERHIRYADVIDLKKVVNTEFNIEGNPIESFTNLVLEIKPTQVTLVPDSVDVLTSNTGWDTKTHLKFLTQKIALFHSHGIRTSIFLNSDVEMLNYALETGTDRVELYTESYASKYFINKEQAIEPFVKVANHAHKIGMTLNAGHDLDLNNLAYFKQNIVGLKEVSIGHALVCDALEMGMENTVRQYLHALQ